MILAKKCNYFIKMIICIFSSSFLHVVYSFATLDWSFLPFYLEQGLLDTFTLKLQNTMVSLEFLLD